MAVAAALRRNKAYHLRHHLDFVEERGGVVSRRSGRTTVLGFPRVRRRGGGGDASRGFCSPTLAPSRRRFLRRRREAQRSCSGVKKMVGGRCPWWRRRPSGEDGGPGAGWRFVGGRSAGFPRLRRRATVDLGSDLKHGDEPRSTRPNANGFSVCGKLLLRLIKPTTAMVLARMRLCLVKMVGEGSSRSFSSFLFCWWVFLHLFLGCIRSCSFLRFPRACACIVLF
jgi:hypothetical protein